MSENNTPSQSEDSPREELESNVLLADENLCVEMVGVDECVHQYNVQLQRTVCGINLMKNQPKSGRIMAQYCSRGECPDF